MTIEINKSFIIKAACYLVAAALIVYLCIVRVPVYWRAAHIQHMDQIPLGQLQVQNPFDGPAVNWTGEAAAVSPTPSAR